MIEHLYTIIIVITYNFILSKTRFLCYYKPHLPKICLYILHGHSSGTHLLILNLKALEESDSLISLGTISHIFGPRSNTDSVTCQKEFALILLNELLLRRSYGLILEKHIDYQNI